ncbi:MAG: response regulator [Flavobacteriia bacterium]|nr:response regulator [Flavobacteriia bacterium]PIV97526.1 MAG: response regulator [Flavobacteriaceae bacterium CG17_big_fil_post_rev_8_21_14_2_50_31_13]PIX15355.1 MAG: response regulator [Flavobacteriaceae bacterium CG_4_8_14_3_um_filter_31_8]PIY14272.1 MAG: response regulator [Flavobacteriaceae bacterium CG_4_10_14_3_um_filter_31_253]PIZ10124.1 MAG: response regulator [Flavobacteriaceae bacterium CG_4_10_14_0_8_um_filter_31_99]PJC10213.1 MAG: response regulator [Flavobacteriaceae bacterium C
MSKQVTFILIDDDAISNMLSEIIIEDEFPDAQIISFTDPKQGIQFFESEFSESSINKTFLFLDINMPLMSGWEFLESLKEKKIEMKNNVFIYMLSSSVNLDDVKKAKLNPNVVDFLEKPLIDEFLKQLSEKHSFI